MEIIYPDENGTAVWWKSNRWDVKMGRWTYYFYNWEVIRLLEFLEEMELIKKPKRKK